LQGLHLLIDSVSPPLWWQCTSTPQQSIECEMKNTKKSYNQIVTIKNCNSKNRVQTHKDLDYCEQRDAEWNRRLKPTRSERLWTSAALVLLVVLARPCGGFFKSADSSSPSWTPSVTSLRATTSSGQEMGLLCRTAKNSNFQFLHTWYCSEKFFARMIVPSQTTRRLFHTWTVTHQTYQTGWEHCT
jgi:hypothetical protein